MWCQQMQSITDSWKGHTARWTDGNFSDTYVAHCFALATKKIKSIRTISIYIFITPFKEGGAYLFAHVSHNVSLLVGMSVSPNFVQLITQQHFTPEASNLVGR